MSTRRTRAPAKGAEATTGTSAPPKAADRVSVRLAKPHTHEGTQYDPGQIIEVSALDAGWLLDHGTAVKNEEETP